VTRRASMSARWCPSRLLTASLAYRNANRKNPENPQNSKNLQNLLVIAQSDVESPHTQRRRPRPGGRGVAE
jgi:hypothetical protein